MFEMHLSDAHLAEHLLDEFVMHLLVVSVICEGLLNPLHVYPFVEGVYHLLFLLEDICEDGLLLLELLEKLPDLSVSVLEDRLQFVSFLGVEPLVLPDVEHPFDLPDLVLQVFEALNHVHEIFVSELGH